jgi:predicted lipoprotein
MKKLLMTVLLLLPVLANAQDMMQKMMAMQQCMEGIDQNELRQLEQKARQFEAELKGLCASGKDQQAQSEAIAFSKQVMASKSLVQVRECSKIMEGMIPEIPFADLEKDYGDMNVCENL